MKNWRPSFKDASRPRRDESTQEAKQPERNLVAEADLHIVIRDIAVGEVGNLLEGLALSSDFEEKLAGCEGCVTTKSPMSLPRLRSRRRRSST